MLSPHDAQLAARDPELIGLPLLLDPHALLQSLQPLLPKVQLQELRCTYLRYKPQTNCLAAYRLKTSLGEIDIYAKALAKEDKAKLYKDARHTGASIVGPDQLLLEKAATRLFIFPCDAELRSLALVGNKEHFYHLLQRVLPDFDASSTYSLCRLAYKPERRFVGQLLRNQRPVAVLRFYSADDFDRANRNAKVLHPNQSVRLPQRLGRSTRHAVTAVEWLEGKLLSNSLSSDSVDPSGPFAVGKALAQLHSSDASKLQLKSRHDEVQSLQEAQEFAAFICPELSEPLETITNQLRNYFLQLPLPGRCIHGDFYASQILLKDDGIAFLDLDDASRGDPAADLGNFLAHLTRQSLQGAFPLSRIGGFRQEILKGYFAAGDSISSRHIDHYTAAALLRLTPEPFRRREQDWPVATATLLQEAQSLLRTKSVSPAAPYCPVEDRFSVASDPQMPFLADALDPLRFQHHLDESFPFAAELRAIRVIRYKPQRRCLLEYDLAAGGKTFTAIGKARARGLDEHTFALQRKLWQGAFGDDSPDGISVPQPLATIPSLHMWLQLKVAGKPAIQLLPRGDQYLCQRIAQAIFKLHQCGLAPRRSHGIGDELRILHERLLELGNQRPDLEDRIRRLLRQCSGLAQRLTAVPTSPIHRDLHPDQLLVLGDRLYILDLDLFSEGDPALDLGNFVAHLSEYALRKLGRPDALAKQENETIETYERLAGSEIRNRTDIYAALTIARLVHISTLFEDRVPFTEHILAHTEERLRELL